MDERDFVILKYDSNRIPSMAACTKCQQKFFTPPHFSDNSDTADFYLRDKFAQHRCLEESPKKPSTFAG